MKEKNKRLRLVKLLLIYLLAIAVGLVAAILLPKSKLYGIVFYVVIVLGLAFYMKTTDIHYKDWLKKPDSKGIYSIVGTVIFVLVWSAITLGLNILLWKSGELARKPISILTVIASCIMAPIIEEFICRGIIIEVLQEKHKKSFVVIVSSQIFYVIHGTLTNISSLFFGLFAANMRMKCNSIIPGICIHFIWNLLAVVLLSMLTPVIGNLIF